nr:hypothetical protein [Caulobacter vibrioides]
MGGVKIGQPVRVAVDAFSVQRYGLVQGVVRSIGGAPVQAAQLGMPFDIKEPVYAVTVEITGGPSPRSTLISQLQPGMTVKAVVATDRRKLFDRFFSRSRDG